MSENNIKETPEVQNFLDFLRLMPIVELINVNDSGHKILKINGWISGELTFYVTPNEGSTKQSEEFFQNLKVVLKEVELNEAKREVVVLKKDIENLKNKLVKKEKDINKWDEK